MSWWKNVLELLFPRKCIFCGEIMSGEGQVCFRCEENLPRLENPLCQEKMGQVERVYCALSYERRVPNAIAAFKFRGKSRLHRYFVKQMLLQMGPQLEDEGCDFMVCVPMYPTKERKRGYNQSALLAQELSVQLNIPCSDCLKKVKKTQEQHNLSGEARRTAQKNSYTCRPLHGEKVLLVDDICTTGETMKECARVLREAGASMVIGAAICSTPWEMRNKLEAPQRLWYDEEKGEEPVYYRMK
ncbi:MAG: ComF family protein [Oscillospiraceae bacterium]|nr:ComF family protein [Oscillospiraceae bacterium]